MFNKKWFKKEERKCSKTHVQKTKCSKIMFRDSFWIKVRVQSSHEDWLRCLRRQRNPFAMMPQARCVGAPGYRHQAQVATPWLQWRRDGDLIPFSMTQCLAGYLTRIVHFPRPEIVLPHISVAVLRVGGLGAKIFVQG